MPHTRKKVGTAWLAVMPKYFFVPGQRDQDRVKLDSEAAHHLLYVLRKRIGDAIVLCDGNGTDYTGTIAHAKKEYVYCDISSPRPSGTEPNLKITLYQAIPKGDKLDTIVQKCIELGVLAIVPVVTARTVLPRIKHSRLVRIAEAAAGQSMRGIIPQVHEALPFSQAVGACECAHTIVAYEGESTISIRQVLPKETTMLNLWVGPEGGFTIDEINALQSAGALAFTLGRRILRTETAALATLSQIICLMEV